MAHADSMVVDLLPHLQPLTALAPERLTELVPLCHRERVARNLDPFTLRDWSGEIVYLMRGELKLDYGDGSMQVLVGGSGEALMPLCRGSQVPVATKAITDIELLCFDEDTLDIFVTWDQLASSPGASRVESAGTDWRMLSGIFTARNLTQGAFAALPAANIESLLARFVRITSRRGDVIIRQGDAGDYYYVIERGRCLVTREVGGATVELAELKEGDAFGEEALVSNCTRNATVTMKTDGALLRLARTDFDELLREPLLQRVTATDALQRVESGAKWIDVRFPAEYRYDGLPGAINIPVNEIRNALAGLDMNKEYIVYCQTGRRSSAAAFLMSQRGFRAALLDGGLKALSALDSPARRRS